MTFIRVLLVILIPISGHASEICVKYMEADSEFSSPYSTMASEKFETVFMPALKKYGEAYMDAYPGGRESKDDKINLELAINWRNMACPGSNLWNQTTFYFWNLYIHMNADDRAKLACQRLAYIDRKYWDLPEMTEADFTYKHNLRNYADDYSEVYSQLISSLQGIGPEVALKTVIEFHNEECSGTHHWTDAAFAYWRKNKTK